MVLIHKCDESGRLISPKNVIERHALWQQYVEASRYATRKIYWKYMEREVYGVVFDGASMSSGTDLMSSSLYSVEIFMELPVSSFSDEVWSYNLVWLKDPGVTNIRDQLEFSITDDEANINLEPCVLWEKVCMQRLPRIPDEHFYLYPDVIEYFCMGIPFTIFLSKLLKTLNVAHAQLHPNN